MVWKWMIPNAGLFRLFNDGDNCKTNCHIPVILNSIFLFIQFWILNLSILFYFIFLKEWKKDILSTKYCLLCVFFITLLYNMLCYLASILSSRLILIGFHNSWQITKRRKNVFYSFKCLSVLLNSDFGLIYLRFCLLFRLQDIHSVICFYIRLSMNKKNIIRFLSICKLLILYSFYFDFYSKIEC